MAVNYLSPLKFNLSMRSLFFVLMYTFVLGFNVIGKDGGMEKSAPFECPGYGMSKLFQLKNGNTFLVHFGQTQGLNIKVFDNTRKKTVDFVAKSKFFDTENPRNTKLEGVYELSGNIALFLTGLEGQNIIMTRMIIDGNTGKILSDEKIAVVEKVSIWAGYMIAFAHSSPPDIFVEKDPNSDCYAVIVYNDLAHETNKRIFVQHFNGDHKLINAAYFNAPNSNFKITRYLSAAVDGDKCVFLSTYASSGKNAKSGLSGAFVSKLSAGSKNFENKAIPNTEKNRTVSSILRFNPKNNKLYLLKEYFVRKTFIDSVFDAELYCMNANSLNVLFSKQFEINKIQSAVDAPVKKKYEFAGRPENMVINADNSISILMEETMVSKTSNSRGTRSGGYKMINQTGISVYSDAGVELNGYWCNKSQINNNLSAQKEMCYREHGRWYAARSKPFLGMFENNADQYCSYEYIETSKGKYVLYNELPENFEKYFKRQPDAIRTYSNTVALLWKLGATENDKLKSLYGSYSADKHSFNYIFSGNYDKSTNTYTTVAIDVNGKEKNAHVIWMDLDQM